MNPLLNDIPFETALYRGLGRAVLFLQETDARLYRKAILDAVLYNKVYDPMFNSDRAWYLFEVIHATGEIEDYARCIRHALKTDDRDYNYDGLYGLACLMAKNGDESTRQAMYDGLPKDIETGYAPGIQALIELDGIAAYSMIAERLAASNPNDDMLREGCHYLPLSYLEEQVGEGGIRTALTMVQAMKPHLTDYVKRVSSILQSEKPDAP